MPFRINEVVARAQTNYGRRIGGETLRKLRAAALQRFGTTTALSEPQLVQLLSTVNWKRQPISPEKRSELLQALSINQRLPVYERQSFAELSQRYSPPGFPISKAIIGILNARVRKRIIAAGGRPTKHFANSPRERATVVKRLRELLQVDFRADANLLAQKLGFPSYKALWKALSRYNTTLDKERKRAGKELISRADLETGKQLTNEELAGRLGLKKSYVSANRTRRGRGAGVALTVRRIRSEALSWLYAFTSPEEGFLRYKVLLALTGSNERTLKRVLFQLKEQGVVRYYTDKNDRSFYSISPTGIRQLNVNGVDSRQRDARIREMPVEKLESIRARLLDARYSTGAGVYSSIVRYLEQLIRQKHLAEKNPKS